MAPASCPGPCQPISTGDLEFANDVAIADGKQELKRRVHVGVGVVLDRFRDKADRAVPQAKLRAAGVHAGVGAAALVILGTIDLTMAACGHRAEPLAIGIEIPTRSPEHRPLRFVVPGKWMEVTAFADDDGVRSAIDEIAERGIAITIEDAIGIAVGCAAEVANLSAAIVHHVVGNDSVAIHIGDRVAILASGNRAVVLLRTSVRWAAYRGKRGLNHLPLGVLVDCVHGRIAADL